MFLDLGFAPPSNAYRTSAQFREPEVYWPLRVRVCEGCWLVQTEDYAQADELFAHDYAYFSSVSQTWLEHSTKYAEMISRKLELNESSFVVEVAANDGYLLRNFVTAGIPCLGIEPTASTAAAAEALGVPIWREFFGRALAERIVAERGRADLIVGNNVYAHVPDINDFTAGLRTLLGPRGTITLEFPHLQQLIAHAQFDTVYHEHFSYLSGTAVAHVFESCGLRVFDVEQLPTHGGSLRIYGCHRDDSRAATRAWVELLEDEARNGLTALHTYAAFQDRADRIKNELLLFLLEQKRAGKRVAAYGAAAKGNTLLNYAGVKPDLLSFVCDAAPSKQGRFLPGSHVPILPPSELDARRPDYVLILPWNIAAEVMTQHARIRQWGARFVVAVPQLTVFP